MNNKQDICLKLNLNLQWAEYLTFKKISIIPFLFLPNIFYISRDETDTGLKRKVTLMPAAKRDSLGQLVLPNFRLEVRHLHRVIWWIAAINLWRTQLPKEMPSSSKAAQAAAAAGLGPELLLLLLFFLLRDPSPGNCGPQGVSQQQRQGNREQKGGWRRGHWENNAQQKQSNSNGEFSLVVGKM